MYSEGEYVIYGMNGVCRVNGITTLDLLFLWNGLFDCAAFNRCYHSCE